MPGFPAFHARAVLSVVDDASDGELPEVAGILGDGLSPLFDVGDVRAARGRGRAHTP